MITLVEVLQGGHYLEGSSASERAAPVGGDDDQESVRYDVGVDDEWEHQPVCEGISGSESVRTRKFSTQAPVIFVVVVDNYVTSVARRYSTRLLSRRWYILHYHRSTLLLPLGERLLLSGGGVEERSKVMYWHRGAYIIYYRDITGHSCIA